MTKKEAFINEINKALEVGKIELSEDAENYFAALNNTADKEKPAFTENGKLILRYLQENKDIYNNLFKARDIGEGLGITSKTASGAMRKLVNDGYAEKIGENPVIYAITDKGISVDFAIEQN